MKELSVEEKVKAYDEALKVASKYKDIHIMFSSIQDEMFPELAESEDERIRKDVISFVEQAINAGYGIISKERKEKWIAWLEKQGEQKPVDKIQLGKKYKCIASPRYSTFMTGKIYKPEDKFLCKLMNFCYDCFEPIEEDEQKVEPKFKVEKDKWYVCTSQYCNCIEGRNYKASLNGRIIDDYGTEYDIHNDAYKYFRLWTIQDAKDGDVLTWDNGRYIVLFKKLQDSIIAHCSYNTHSKHLGFYTVYDTQFDSNLRFVPATKEQRDILFQKMKEAGYEWDSEKKELKKIEQEQVIDYPDNLPKDNWELVQEFVNKFGRIPKDEDELNALVKYVLKKQNPWSEEDKKMLDDIIEASTHHCYLNITDINWLKSLKDRVQPQPKQEWSEEDEYLLDETIKHLESLIRITEKQGSAYSDEIQYYQRDIDWLKSLRPQKWRPTEDQIMCLQDAISNYQHRGYKAETLESLCKQLKQL